MGDPARSHCGLRRRHGRRAGNYHRPRDPDRPLVWLDETSMQRSWRPASRYRPSPDSPRDKLRIPAQRPQPFLSVAQLEGWRRVEVTDHHAAVDYAKVLKELSDVDFPAAKKIVLVQDNLSTHRPASLYAAFPAPEARRLVNRFEWHYTPQHGSWLDMAESELAVLTTQCRAAASPTKRPSRKRSRPGRAIETNATPKPTGNSRRKRPRQTERLN